MRHHPGPQQPPGHPTAHREASQRAPHPEERWTSALARRMFATQDGRSQSFLVQLPLAWVLLVFWLSSLTTPDGRQVLFYTAFVLVSTLLCLGLLLPWQRLPRHASLAIPILDFAAVALSGSSAGGYRPEISMLAVFPVVWLAVSGASARWTLPVTLTGTALVTVPPLLQRPDAATADQVAFSIIMPLVMTALAAGIHAATANQGVQSRQIRRQQRAMEQMLAESQQSEELLRATVEAIDVGVLAIDSNGRTLLRNSQQQYHLEVAAAAAAHGHKAPAETPTHTAAPPQPDLLVYGPDRTTPLPPEKRPEARALAGEEFSHQLLWLGRGESQRAVSVTARSMGKQDAHRGSVLAFTDITDLMHALAAKDQFLSNVTHDLRSPLSAILGRADLVLERGGLPERSVKDLESVIANAERLQTMVQDLLFAASGTLRVKQRPVDLHDLVEVGVDASARLAVEAGVSLVTDVSPSVPAFADPVRVLQVLDNLISNAIKYSPEGGCVTVRARLEEPAGPVRPVGPNGPERTHEPSRSRGLGRPDARYIPPGLHGQSAVLEIEDAGHGMTEEEVKNVFNRFYRTDGARRSPVPGVGLGLYITKAIVEAHRGTISCSSRSDRGTVFTVRLPVAEVIEQAA